MEYGPSWALRGLDASPEGAHLLHSQPHWPSGSKPLSLVHVQGFHLQCPPWWVKAITVPLSRLRMPERERAGKEGREQQGQEAGFSFQLKLRHCASVSGSVYLGRGVLYPGLGALEVCGEVYISLVLCLSVQASLCA
jgi:hypothetical protein